MSGGLYTRFSLLPTEDNSGNEITQEVPDLRFKREAGRKVNREQAQGQDSGNRLAKGESDDHNLLWSIPQFPGNQSDDNANDAAVKEEERPIMKRARTHIRPRAPAQYNYDSALKDARAEARGLGMVELPIDQVARVMEGGELTDIYHVNWVKNTDYFITYDGAEVLARVEDFEMETAVYNIAALHIGRHLKWSHPMDHDLEVSSKPMKNRLAGGFAVKISAMTEEPAKKRRGPSRMSRV
ncbi:hypothetical protein PG993_008491 [Apiospora rasikravindrae]|uniref:Uncharacterized protein n=1 Tax=Apiospora rasikravindrae TaxID=990691 RepID=A0ABR1T0I6_9PEZI